MQMPDKIDGENGIVAEHSRVLEASKFKRELETALITLTPATRGLGRGTCMVR